MSHLHCLDPHGAAVQTHHVHSYSYHDNQNDDLDLCELTSDAIQVNLDMLIFRYFLIIKDTLCTQLACV